ncbi:hypothetical protein B566_EDAN017907 [Ephemera danica]|nr:hypothetical protein B566_EDAN017907 [Ephemera danica]
MQTSVCRQQLNNCVMQSIYIQVLSNFLAFMAVLILIVDPMFHQNDHFYALLVGCLGIFRTSSPLWSFHSIQAKFHFKIGLCDTL